MANLVRVGVYCRVSTSKQENQNQLDQLREFAAKQDGWKVVDEFIDVVSSSGKKDRVQFDAMMLAASKREFDVLLFWKLDRLSREGVRRTLVHLTRLDGWGVRWRSFQEPFFDSCGIMRDVVISIMATLAEQERINVSERTKAGLQRARKAGRRLGRAPMPVDIARFRQLRAKGQSLRAIAAAMGCSASLLVKKQRLSKLGANS
jgi:DNA invertase Pin-like site-specific DNA recombinase